MSDDVKAGTYELVAVLWDEPLSKPGEPFDFKRHRKGDKVKLDVEEARRLVAAGAVVKPGDLEKARAAAAKAQYLAALAAVPEEFRDQITGGDDVPNVEESVAPESEEDTPADPRVAQPSPATPVPAAPPSGGRRR